MHLDIVLHMSSFGPVKGNFNGGPRIPAAGESLYNLNSLPVVCPELFPTPTQDEAYWRPAFPVHQAPVWDFTGDGVRYDPKTGEALPAPELPRDQRPRSAPITPGHWLKAERNSTLEVKLTNYAPQQQAFTAASFRFKLTALIPRAVYTAWSIRLNTLAPPQGDEIEVPSPLCPPNVFSTDDKGTARFACKVDHPFPTQGAARLLHIQGVTVAFHNTFQNWGACFARFGVGADHHVHLTTGLTAFDLLKTAAKP